MTEPMTPPDCDLRGMPYMPLDVVRLLDSDLFALSTGEEFKAALALWCRAFLQVPAGSLPDDDRILAHLSATGPRWPKLRDMALRGWVKCSDGRLYHPVVAEKARDAWQARLAQRARTEAARAAKAAKRADSVCPTPPAPPVAEDVAMSVTETVTGSKGREGKGSKEKEEEPSLRSGPAEPVAGPAEPPPDARASLFREGLARLQRLTGQPDKPSRALLGRLLRDARDDAAGLGLVLAEAEAMRPADPVPWLIAAVARRSRGEPPRPERIDPRLAGILHAKRRLAEMDEAPPYAPGDLGWSRLQ